MITPLASFPDNIIAFRWTGRVTRGDHEGYQLNAAQD